MCVGTATEGRSRHALQFGLQRQRVQKDVPWVAELPVGGLRIPLVLDSLRLCCSSDRGLLITTAGLLAQTCQCTTQSCAVVLWRAQGAMCRWRLLRRLRIRAGRAAPALTGRGAGAALRQTPTLPPSLPRRRALILQELVPPYNTARMQPRTRMLTGRAGGAAAAAVVRAPKGLEGGGAAGAAAAAAASTRSRTNTRRRWPTITVRTARYGRLAAR